MNSQNLNNEKADLYIPDGTDPEEAIGRTTHLGVGAHQDDLEFMAMHGILECHGKADNWFSGITCTNGSGSARTGPFAAFTNAQMMEVRLEEQREAARVGEYGFMAQLGYSSAEIKDAKRDDFIKDLRSLLLASKPEVVYTHNPADKHTTHIAVVTALIQTIRTLPQSDRPGKVIGCEGWRDLDWLPDDKKVIMDLSGHPELALRLNGIFNSQISGGKRYDLAVQGRRSANATFFDSHSVDEATSVCFGMDLTPLIEDDSISLLDFTCTLIDELKADVQAKLGG
ncbi:MAG: PIG-L deacetylase family protein [Puniceicoccaceae bacterium]